MINELEKLARAATPGPWEAFNDTVLVEDKQAETEIATCHGFEFNEDTVQVDAAFIAAANPVAILQLISINRELVAALELVKQMVISNGWSIGFTMEVVDKALARSNGESNE